MDLSFPWQIGVSGLCPDALRASNRVARGSPRFAWCRGLAEPRWLCFFVVASRTDASLLSCDVYWQLWVLNICRGKVFVEWIAIACSNIVGGVLSEEDQ